MSEGFILATPAATAAFQYLRVAHALALEINTEMAMSRGSIMNLAKRYCGSPKRTKRGVLKDYVEWLPTVIPNYVPAPGEGVAKALVKPKAVK
jgi:hypothetical protein